MSDVNLQLFSQMTPEELRLLTVSRNTAFPDSAPRFDEASYDVAIFEAHRKRPDFNSGDCSERCAPTGCWAVRRITIWRCGR